MSAKLGAWLVSLAGPVAKQVMVSLGIGVVSMAGVGVALNTLLDQARGAYASVPAVVAQYLALGGVNVALSIIAGACIARLSLIPLKTLKLL